MTDGPTPEQMEMMIPILAIVFGSLIALGAIITTGARKAAQTKQQEQSRREIAAYIAEGSISPDEGERLLNAGKKRA